ncbi:MAG: NAD(P)-dependent oxidoreductase, partial [Pseudomonadota bacterium]
AITEALANGTIAGAGLDVFEVEPSPADDPLMAAQNAILTPHALCFTDQCFAGIGASDVAAVQAVMRGEAPSHVVNREVFKTERWKARVAHYRATFG